MMTRQHGHRLESPEKLLGTFFSLTEIRRNGAEYSPVRTSGIGVGGERGIFIQSPGQRDRNGCNSAVNFRQVHSARLGGKPHSVKLHL